MGCLAVIPDGMCDQHNWSACRPWDGDKTAILAHLGTIEVANEGLHLEVDGDNMGTKVGEGLNPHDPEQEVSETDYSNTLEKVNQNSPHCQQEACTGLEYREVGLFVNI